MIDRLRPVAVFLVCGWVTTLSVRAADPVGHVMDSPFVAAGEHWCATGPENDARLAQAEARAAALRAASGKTISRSPAEIYQRYGMLILNDIDNDVLLDNQPFDLGGKTLRFVRTDPCCFDVTQEAVDFDEDLGDLEAAWENVWGQSEIVLPFSFPFGTGTFTSIFVTSDIGVFFTPQSEDGASDQYESVDFSDGTPRITPALRRGVWAWSRNVDLYVKADLTSITLTWYQRPTGTTSIYGIDHHFQATLAADGEISFSYPDSSSSNTFGLVQVVAPGAAAVLDPVDFSVLNAVPTPLPARIGEAFTFPSLLDWTARNVIRDRFGELALDVDLYGFYQNFYTEIVFWAGAYHSGDILHMNEIDLSWNSRDETANHVLSHEAGHDWLYFGLPSGTGAHPRKGADTRAAFDAYTPFDSSVMGGGFWLDNADGSFTSLPHRTHFGFSWHELYLMGLATREEVEDWWYISGVPELDDPYYPPAGSTFVGGRVDLTEAVLDAVAPEYPDSQTHFKILLTLVTRSENPVRDRDFANMRRKMKLWTQNWSDATGERSTLDVYFGELDPTGDFDFDGDVDLLDFGGFQACVSGSRVVVPVGDCRAGDLDGDTDVDVDDFALWDSLFTGHCGEPVYDDHPQAQFACAGSDVTFRTSVRYADTVQWRRTGVDLPGEIGDTLTLYGVTPFDSGTYSVMAENACGAVMSATANLTVAGGPQVVLYPNQVALCPGTPAVFTPTVDGAGGFTYQWHKDGVAIPGAAAERLVIDSPVAGDAGEYTVVVTDDCESSESNRLIASVSCP